MAAHTMQAKRMHGQQEGLVVLPPVRRGVVVAILLCAVVVVFITWFMGDDFRIHNITVENNQAVPATQIMGASGLTDEYILFVDLNAAAKRVQALPGISASEITCTWRAGCVILVQPSPAIAVWQSAGDNTDKMWSDGQGKVQKALGDVKAKLTIQVEEGSLPTLGAPIDDHLSNSLNQVLALQPGVTNYSYSRQYGLMFTEAHGMQIRLGVAAHDGDMRNRLALVKQISDQLAAQKSAPQVIDVRFMGAPYYIK
ncbi:MAG: FtsQ-type POTRA domain-containing protein [Chloroflexi bacterium]|nr:FtsQ-type POTRA domain-containing protein [Chloroflexota bacterium]